MTPFRHNWAKGAAAGLGLALAVIAAAFAGLTDSRLHEPPSPATEVVRVLAAMPLFLTAPARNAPEPVQVVVLVAWWMGVGALFGWSAGAGGRGKLLAGLLAIVVIAGHVHTKITIERGIEAALTALGEVIRDIMR